MTGMSVPVVLAWKEVTAAGLQQRCKVVTGEMLDAASDRRVPRRLHEEDDRSRASSNRERLRLAQHPFGPQFQQSHCKRHSIEGSSVNRMYCVEFFMSSVTCRQCV